MTDDDAERTTALQRIAGREYDILKRALICAIVAYEALGMGTEGELEDTKALSQAIDDGDLLLARDDREQGPLVINPD